MYLKLLAIHLLAASCYEAYAVPLTSHILHYQPLNYDSDAVRQSHDNIVKRSTDTSSTHAGTNRYIHISFTAFNSNLTLMLWPSKHDLFGHNPRFIVHTPGGGTAPSKYDPDTYYKGRIVGQDHSRAHGHIREGVFDGKIVTEEGQHLQIELASKYFTHSTFHSVIYDEKDIVINTTRSCGAKDQLLDKLSQLQATGQVANRRLRRRATTDSTHTLSGHMRGRGIGKRQGSGRYCQMKIAADHLFVSNVDHVHGSESAAISEIASAFSEVQNIYQTTDFDGDGSSDFILPQLVETEILTSDSYGGLFAEGSISVDDFLDRWSQIDQTAYCLSLLLTYRDFADGVLGLAWVASSTGSRGGVCDSDVNLSVGRRSLNTAIVTYLNYGSEQPRAVTTVTIAHELGHNFGSSHDPESDGQCAPGSSSGNFIMYPRATDGDRSNNNRFSPCSISSIQDVLESDRASCFTDNSAFCGNQIIEEGEECDCGSNDDIECDMVDNCCVAGECMLKSTATCSATDACCTDECAIATSGTECRAQTDCAVSEVCDGSSSQCPAVRNRDRACNGGLNYCVNGACTGPVCLVRGWDECQCSGDSELCHVCCLVNGTSCVSTFSLTQQLNITSGQFRDNGRSCDNYRGYCDDSRMCISVDNEQTLNDLLDIFTIDTLNSVIEWLKSYWWVPIVAVVVIIGLIVLMHLTYRKRKPLKNAARRASATVRRSSTRRASSDSGQGLNASQAAMRELEQTRESLQRVKKFFPDCEAEVIFQVLRSTRNEKKTVKILLDQGNRFKKVPLPRL